MEPALPLDPMTSPMILSDKLRVLEELWEDLCRTPESVPSPLAR